MPHELQRFHGRPEVKKTRGHQKMRDMQKSGIAALDALAQAQTQTLADLPGTQPQRQILQPTYKDEVPDMDRDELREKQYSELDIHELAEVKKALERKRDEYEGY